MTNGSAIGLGLATAALVLNAHSLRAQTQPRENPAAQTCRQMYEHCKTRSDYERFRPLCDVYYGEAAQTGTFPSYNREPAVPCRR